jgi:aspartate carbamoyltransferase catalytic subunit
VFFEESLRTRVGFASAAARLDWSVVVVDGLRLGATSMAESWEDTLRTLSGLVDVVITRPGMPLERSTVETHSRIPIINGGDRGSTAEHPSQALIDAFAIERLKGPIESLTVAVVGDLRMRAARSLLRLLERRRPAALVAITDDDFLGPHAVNVERREPWRLDDVDVLYVVGMPHESLPLERRERLLVGEDALASLPADAVVLSPLPVIDEIAPAARHDRRIRIFDQSDWSVPVRVAILEHVAGWAHQRGTS